MTHPSPTSHLPLNTSDRLRILNLHLDKNPTHWAGTANTHTIWEVGLTHYHGNIHNIAATPSPTVWAGPIV